MQAGTSNFPKEQVMPPTDVQSIFSLTLHQEINVESQKNNTSLTSQSNINENMTLLYFEGVTLIDFLLLFFMKIILHLPQSTSINHVTMLTLRVRAVHLDGHFSAGKEYYLIRPPPSSRQQPRPSSNTSTKAPLVRQLSTYKVHITSIMSYRQVSQEYGDTGRRRRRTRYL
jgi:hypothetical protein